MTRPEVAAAIAEAIAAERRRWLVILDEERNAQRKRGTDVAEMLRGLRWALEYADATGIVPEELR